MTELSLAEIELISGGSLAYDVGHAVGSAIAGAVDGVQTFCSDVSGFMSGGLNVYAGTTV